MHLLLKIVIFCLFVLEVSAFRLGSFYEKASDQTVFRVYATKAEIVELATYESQKGKIKQVYQMYKATLKPANEMEREVSKNTYEIKLKGNLIGSWYKFRAVGNNSFDYQVISNQKIQTKFLNAELFIFHKEAGYMVDTTASGYSDSFSQIVKKEKLGDELYFYLNEGSFSDYAIEVVPRGEFPTRVNELFVADPYCYELDLENDRCQVSDFDSSFFENRPQRPGFFKGHTINEVHLKDLTYLLPGIPENIRGTYKAVAHPKTLKMLKDLGVTTLEFLPLHSFDRHAAPPGEINYWGYMTKGFFALHSSYAKDSLKSRFEFKEAVDALHKIGISVVLDVVFNHSAEGDHRGPVFAYKNLARDEYFRMYDKKAGFYLNTAGCGNVFASESPVTRKLILDSLQFFYEVYLVDGFRFDLAAAIDKETLVLARKMLGDAAFMSGEPWVAEGNPHWQRGDLNEIRFGKWNDQFRYAALDFISGKADAERMKVLVRGEHRDFGGSGSSINTDFGDSNPEGSINEIEVHDGNTLYDRLIHFDKKEARIRLANTLLLTSVNIPIMQLGQEFARSKQGNSNSYNLDSEINWIDYSLVNKNKDLKDFSVGLKKLRTFYSAFHNKARITDDKIWFYNSRQNNNQAFAYKLKGSDYEFLILVNGSENAGADFDIPAGVWNIVSNGYQISDRGLGVAKDEHYYLKPIETAILKKKVTQ